MFRDKRHRKEYSPMAAPASYTRMQIGLHWLIAAIVGFQIVFAEGIKEAWEARMTGAVPNEPYPTPHTIAGIVIFALMLWRLALRLRHGAPPPPASEHPALRFVAGATHVLFYVLLIGMPLSGAAAWFFGLDLPAQAHGIAAKALIALTILHIAAAIAHRFWFKSGVMERMLPGRG
jgi:cytochrome b561